MKLSLYVHLPFCISKCDYCDFNSIVAPASLRREYLDALLRELAYYAADPRFAGRELDTVFWGGGTPTSLEVDQLDLLARKICEHFPLAEDVEWSVEANPGTVNREKLRALRQNGVNRISLGVQSFDNSLLQRIGRSHTAEEAVAAVSYIKESGFENLSLDLIFGLPGQSLSLYRESLLRALDLRPQHLSLYGLQVEEGTPFAREHASGRLELPEEGEELAMMALGRELLAAAGMNHYEISNYALPGRECRHNLVYWENREYLGLGAGAFSYAARQRFGHLASPAKYTAHWKRHDAPGIEECETVTPELERAETLMLGFRLLSGVEVTAFEARFGTDFWREYGDVTLDLLGRGLLVQEGQRLYLSERGLPLANQVFGAFLFL